MLYLGNIPIAGLTKPLVTRNVGEIIASSLPLTDAGLHLLDGSLLQGSGIYSGFVNYIANLYNVQETEWTQPILTSNGTLGGDTFAVYASNNYDATYFPLYLSFDGNSSTIWYNSTAPVDGYFVYRGDATSSLGRIEFRIGNSDYSLGCISHSTANTAILRLFIPIKKDSIFMFGITIFRLQEYFHSYMHKVQKVRLNKNTHI